MEPLHKRVIIDGDEFPEHLITCSEHKITQGDLVMSGRRKKFHRPDGVFEYHPYELEFHNSPEIRTKFKSLLNKKFKMIIIDEDGLGLETDRKTIPDCRLFDYNGTPSNAESAPIDKIKFKIAGNVPVETSTI